MCRFTPRWYLSATQRPFQIDFGSLSKIGSRNTCAYNILLLMTSYCSIFWTFYRFINESGHLARYFNVRIRACIYPYGDNVDPVRVTRRLIIFRMHVLMKLYLTHRLDNFIFRFSFVPLKSVSSFFFFFFAKSTSENYNAQRIIETAVDFRTDNKFFFLYFYQSFVFMPLQKH